MKASKKLNHSSDCLQKNWLAEMRQILTPSGLVDKIVQDRITKHIHSCFLAMDNLQTNSLFFLLDSTHMEYLFVSNSTQAVLGFSKDEIIEKGFQWLFSLLSPAELEYKKTVVDDFLSFLKSLGREKTLNVTVRYDIVALRKDAKRVHLLEEVMFPEVNDQGEPVLISCFLHDIGDYINTEKRQCRIYLHNHDGLQTIFSKAYCVCQKEKAPLSRREIQVLEQFSNGLTTTQVAKKLFVTENTIKTHRKNILLKLDVQNTAEAVKFSIKNKWII
jgi:DNA-binding CsgD family transcriptional regulator